MTSPRGTCPSCGQDDLPITDDGLIGQHISRTISGFRQKCPGVGQPPAAAGEPLEFL